MTIGIIYWGIMISLVGMVFLRYGKKRSDGLTIVTGLVLMIYPYFFSSLGWNITFGILVLAAYAFLKLVIHF